MNFSSRLQRQQKGGKLVAKKYPFFLLVLANNLVSGIFLLFNSLSLKEQNKQSTEKQRGKKKIKKKILAGNKKKWFQFINSKYNRGVYIYFENHERLIFLTNQQYPSRQR